MAGFARKAAAVLLCWAAVLAQAHDSWLAPARGDAPAGELRLALVTGSRYPLREIGVPASSVAQARCAGADGATTALAPVREQPQELELAARLARPVACWLELHEAQVQIEPPLVQVYFADIQAPEVTRAAWAAQQRRQVPWRERYRKYARVELRPAEALGAAQWAAARKPAGLGLEIVVLGDRPVEPGQPVSFQVLRDGQPLAGLPVQLVSERSPLGIWRRTDAQGLLQHQLPFGGRWLLRGTDLRESAQEPGTWESRFVTLAIDAG